MSVQRHELHLLTGSYALDALTGDEQADFEKHLARCPACAEEVRGLRETAARLAMATAVSPPPEMRPRVLAAVPRTRQLPPPGRNLLARAGERTGLRRLSPSRAGLTAGVLALAAAVAFLLVTQVSTSRQLQQAQAGNSAIAAVLAAPDARIESLPATVGGTVTAVLSLREREAVVTTADIPSLPGSRVYQLWVITAVGGGQVRRTAHDHEFRLGGAPPRLRRPAGRPARDHRGASGRERAADHDAGRHRAGDRVAGRT